MPIDIFITYQGVHKSIDREIAGSNVAIPKSILYQNISVPRWNNIIGADVDTILSNLYYNNYDDNFRYNIGFFKETARHRNFKSLVELFPTGTKIWFVKTTLDDYREVFLDWITVMKSRGQENVLKDIFRNDSTFNDQDIQYQHEIKSTDIDDFADRYKALDWIPFDSNVYLNNQPASSTAVLQARLFVKPENFSYPRRKKENYLGKLVDDLDDDDDNDYINENDLL